MSVRAIRRVGGVGRLVYNVSAADLLKSEHPLHKSFLVFCGGNITKRQAVKFLQKYPTFRQMKSA